MTLAKIFIFACSRIKIQTLPFLFAVLILTQQFDDTFGEELGYRPNLTNA